MWSVFVDQIDLFPLKYVCVLIINVVARGRGV